MNSATPLKAIIFDLDDTLLDRTATFEKYIPCFARRYAQDLAPCELEKLRAIILDADGKGYRPRPEVMAILRTILPWITAPSIEALLNSYAEDFLACLCPAEGLLDTLHAIKNRGLKTAIITNGPVPRQRNKIARLGIDHLIDIVIVSDEVGIKKPDSRIYELALSQLQCNANQVLMIGDNPDFDVIAPIQLGMQALWLPRMLDWPDDKPRCGQQIASLRDLIAILD